ncbi:MAG: ABC transporter ATP-binding protein [Phycisphaerales bacterium]|nr:ABC transporter ATP-binding protein [bacterium]
MSIIQCENLRKTYRIGTRSVEALRGATLEIDEPGFYAIMGQSGSGKSTLLHLLAGLDDSDGGTVSVAGKRLDEMDDRALTEFRRTEIGVVFQQFNLIPTMTARENIELPGMLAGRPADELKARSSELLKQLGIAERADHRPEALSGGEQQRVAIARSLLFSPAVIFADEPTGNLDSASAEQLWSLLAALAEQQQITVIMVTHEPSAASHCKRTYLLRDGVVSGTIETGAMDATDIAAEYQRLSRSA